MSDFNFSISLENNKPVIIDDKGNEAEKTIVNIKRIASGLSIFSTIYMFAILSYTVYGIISFMMYKNFDFIKILCTFLFFLGWVATIAMIQEVESKKGKYIQDFSKIKMKLFDEMAEIEIKALKHRIALETVEKESKMSFVNKKEMQINA